MEKRKPKKIVKIIEFIDSHLKNIQRANLDYPYWSVWAKTGRHHFRRKAYLDEKTDRGFIPSLIGMVHKSTYTKYT